MSLHFNHTTMLLKTVAIISVCGTERNFFGGTYAIDFLVKELTTLECDTRKITILQDNVNLIAFEVKSLMKQFDFTLIIGEKLSSVYKALGKLTGEELIPNEGLAQVLNDDEASIPVSAKVLNQETAYPVVHFQRIFILNTKDLSEVYAHTLRAHLAKYRTPRIFKKTFKVITNGNTSTAAEKIEKLATDFQVNVDLEKQPKCFNIIGTSTYWEGLVAFQEKLEAEFNIPESRAEINAHEIFSEGNSKVQESLKHIKKCLNEYGPENVFISFNGGKDCTVLLHLFLNALRQFHPNYNGLIVCVYVQSENPFPEQEKFISNCRKYYNFQLITVTLNIKDSLRQLLAQYPHFKACLMGTRRTDPYSANLHVFQQTDPDWPQIMRISPLLDWHYCDIWDYLLYFKVPYCCLYDMGFTSLGNVVNTTRNSSLIYRDIFKDEDVYLPAYKLLDEKYERNGRNTR